MFTFLFIFPIKTLLLFLYPAILALKVYEKSDFAAKSALELPRVTFGVAYNDIFFIKKK